MVAQPPRETIELDSSEYYLNRELSELEFQRRVLHEAQDERNPLLERVKFLSMVTRNLDEFVRKRVGGLKQRMSAGLTDRTVDGRTPREEWTEVIEVCRELQQAQTACYHDDIRPALDAEDIPVVDHADLDSQSQAELREYFEESVLPTLTPLTFDAAHPFPFISNQSLSLAVLTRTEASGETQFARVKIPPNRPRLVRVGDAIKYVLLEQIVAANLDLLFPNTEICSHSLFRVTRNAEIRDFEEDLPEDQVEMVEKVLRERRFASVVRLEIQSRMPAAIRELLVEQLDLNEREVFELEGPIDFRDFMPLTDLDRADLKLDSWTPQPHPRLSSGTENAEADDSDVLREIRRGDVLLHHPYHSFMRTVHRFLDEAAHDPDVLAIKIAIYRTAPDSEVIGALIEAARNGKQVAALVELKARFDEKANLKWVDRLEEEGIHVAYGTPGYKTHTKTALVVREESESVQLYSHIGTGNYHSETATTYTDLGLLTADQEVGNDLLKVFNYFTGNSLHEDYRKLLVAPPTMRTRFTELIGREADLATDDDGGRIVAKMNGLEDPEIVKELYKASMAGVEIDLLVRDICRLRPGLDDISENIRVYSVVGRFLEHSRVFYFANGGDPEYFIGSADWMTRNLDHRVEAVAPVEDPTLRTELRTLLNILLNDNQKRWEMQSDGSYCQLTPSEDEETINTQEVLMRHSQQMGDTLESFRNTPLESEGPQ
jgi:polyphosphate kinase